MRFTKILCPTDFSPGAKHAMRVAVRVAADSGAELVLTHIWHLPALAFTGEHPFPRDATQAMVQDEQRVLSEAVNEALKLGAPKVTSRLVTGVPWEQIVAILREEPYDLVVMGTHGRTGLARVLLGSVTETVIRHSPCSALAVRGRGEATAYRHILCPIDFSDSARHAVERAAELAAPSSAGITLLHVIEPPVRYPGEVPGSFTDGTEPRPSQVLERWASELKAKVTVPVTTELRTGHAATQTLEALDGDPTYDLVVMGSHGRTGVRRLVLGSVAEKVARHATCPVFVARVRTPE